MVEVYVPLLIVRGLSPDSRIWLAVSLVFFVAGGSIYTWCVWDFAVFGRGTPAPINAPKKLVVQGMYHYTRNPMYLGVLTIILGWAVLYKAPRLVLYALCVGLSFHCFIVFSEEPHLQRMFGSSYEEYRARVRHWFPDGVARKFFLNFVLRPIAE
jgi:protein-S-isoprenylcysteine O-methyltransferase Ste14